MAAAVRPQASCVYAGRSTARKAAARAAFGESSMRCCLYTASPEKRKLSHIWGQTSARHGAAAPIMLPKRYPCQNVFSVACVYALPTVAGTGSLSPSISFHSCLSIGTCYTETQIIEEVSMGSAIGGLHCSGYGGREERGNRERAGRGRGCLGESQNGTQVRDR